MAIKKHEEIRLNVKPIFLTLYHEYVFEGPVSYTHLTLPTKA